MSSETRKMVWSKLKSPFKIPGRYRKQSMDSLVSKLTINEEYMEALRTNSYVEMYSKIQDQLGRSRLTSSSSFPLHIHLSDYLLEPRQETLVSMIQRSNLHHLLIDYFHASLEACNTCELLLHSVHQMRANYPIIKGVLVHDSPNDQSHSIIGDLASFALLNNPLSTISQSQFCDIRDSHNFLLRKLTLKYRKVRRTTKLRRFCKKLLGYTLIVSYGALAIVMLVLIFHSIIGAIAAPGLIACFLGLFKKRKRVAKKMVKTRSLERLCAQLDVAAKGVYILINDFDTMSRLVRRLNDEIEHRKAIADFCAKNGKSDEVLKEVVREFGIHESGVLEQLEELEEHIYLCFLTINRSRRLVLQEARVLQSEL